VVMDTEEPDMGIEHGSITSIDTDSAPDFSMRWNECLHRVARFRDREAFQMLFGHFAPLIKSFAYKVPNLNQADTFADELVQESMIKVWTKAESFDSTLASAGTWIFTIARNTRIDLIRKNSRHVKNAISTDFIEDDTLEAQDIWLEDTGTDVFNQIYQQRGRRMIQEAFRDLPEEQAEILKKVYLEDKSHTEVAEELSLPLGTVKSRVRLALKKLRIAIDR
jgi:RNA polymerase sigma-70 factor, ECF subfamily